MLAIRCELQRAVTTTVPTYDKLLEIHGDKPYYAHLGRPLAEAADLIPSTNCRPRMYCNLL
jgi:hypothetical protein